ncbi:MAG TPA: Lpg1974 family pore-forming outer membrane protein [Rhabdochlamydiaceae bacterium]|nr:Lpg1974 family pore-forming outer membrane protein [Rhabdochlamydiaceae bacterium]
MDCDFLKKKYLLCISALSIVTLVAEETDTKQAEPQFNLENQASPFEQRKEVEPIKRKNAHSPLKILALHVNDLKRQVKDLREQVEENSLVARLDEMQQKITHLEDNNQQELLTNAINNLVSQLTEMQEKIAEIEDKSEHAVFNESINQVAMEVQDLKSRVDEIGLMVQGVMADSNDSAIEQSNEEPVDHAQLPEKNKVSKCNCEPASMTLTPRERGRKAPFYVFADLLYWKVEEGGTEYADSFTFNPVQPAALTGAKSKEIDFDYDVGFRVGVGYNLPYDGWDACLDYTSFRTSETESNCGTFFPLLAYEGVNGIFYVAQNVKAHWRVELDDIDFELGNEYYSGKHFSFRTAIGFKAAKIEQHAKITYSNLRLFGAVTNVDFIVKAENEFKGIGPKIGIGSSWDLGMGFSLFGNLGAALLAGWFDVDQTQTQIGAKVIEIDSDFKRFVPTLEILLGVAWDWYFYDDQFHLGVNAGFESQYWWRQNQIEQFVDNLTPVYQRFSEDLSFHGLTVGLRFDF